MIYSSTYHQNRAQNRGYDYYPFGMGIKEREWKDSSFGYRFGFNGQEQDNEVSGSGNSYTAEFWQYDSRLGRRFNVDPITYPWQSSYATLNNNPIVYIDPDGLFGKRKEARQYKKDNNIKGRVMKNEEGGFSINDRTNGNSYTRFSDQSLKEMGVSSAEQLIGYVGDGVVSSVMASADGVGYSNKIASHYSLSDEQKMNVQEIITDYNKLSGDDYNSSQLAYILATARWETARTFKPIREYGKGKGRPYGKVDSETGQAYYGRGYVQLTWKYNYVKYSAILEDDLVNNPDLALNHTYASYIIVHGMLNGVYTGKSLRKYVNSESTDFVNARRVVNGTDKAYNIAAMAKELLRLKSQ